MVGNSQSEFTVKIHTFIPRNSKIHFTRGGSELYGIISSLHIAFSLCVRVGWCDVCTDFTNVIKVDVDVNEMSLVNI